MEKKQIEKPYLEKKKLRKRIIVGSVAAGVLVAVAVPTALILTGNNDSKISVSIITEAGSNSNYNVEIDKGITVYKLKNLLKPIEGYEIEGVYHDARHSMEFGDDEIVSGTETLYIKYKEKEYVVRIHDEDGTLIDESDPIKYNSGLELENLEKPEDLLAVYEFVAWVDANGNVVDLTKITSDLDIYPKYNIIYHEYEIGNFAKQVQITSGGNTLSASDTLHYQQRINITYTPSEDFKVKRFEVLGAEWNEELNCYEVTGNLTVVYEEVQEYFKITKVPSNVQIKRNGEVLTTADKVKYDEELTIEYTESVGYEKTKFEVSGANASSGAIYVVRGNLSIEYEEQKRTYTVRFLDEDKASQIDAKLVKYDEDVNLGEVTKPAKVADKKYTYSFSKWVDANGKDVDFTHVTENMEVYASYTSTLIGYTIDEFSNHVQIKKGNSILTTENTLHYDDEIEITFTATVGYNGSVSVTGATRVGETNKYKVTGKLSVAYAETIRTFNLQEEFENVTIKRGEETVTTAMVLNYGDEITISYTEQTGFHMTEFKVNGNNFENGATLKVTDNITIIYTQVKNKYTVTFYDEDGTTLLATKTDVEHGSAITLDNPTKAETEDDTFTFANWLNEAGKVVDISNITASQILHASYTRTSKSAYLNFTLNEDKASYCVTGMNNNAVTEVRIPGTYEGLPVTLVGDNAFKTNETMTSVTIPASVTSIGNNAFYQCLNLKAVTFAEGSQLTTISSSAFYGCASLSSMNLAETKQLISIDASAFDNCSSLTEIEIPSSVTNIGDLSFNGCENLTTVTIESAEVYSAASNGSYGHLLDNATTIKVLKTIVNDPRFSTDEYIVDYGTPYLMGANFAAQEAGDYYVFVPATTYDYLTFNGNSVTGLSDTTVTEVVIPSIYKGKKIISIGNIAFYNCSEITSATIPNSVTNIGYSAFENCSNLSSITFAEGSKLTDIRGYAFKSCTNLTTIEIPNGVTNIEDYAFQNCTSLTDITIPSGVMSIRNHTFHNCTNLSSINFAEGSQLASIENSAFYGCSSLTKITIPSGVSSIGDNAFYNCSSLTEVTISSSVTSIGSSAFENCLNLSSITFAEGSKLTSIGGYAFKSCTNLATIEIPNSVIDIGDCAFQSCTSLTGITIPSGVTNIRMWAFSGCTNLSSITFADGSHLTSIEDSVFYGCSSLTAITIPSGVSSIGHNAFYNCSSLTAITISSSVTSIGSSAFENCSNLSSITFTEGSKLTSIGDYAFINCKNLTTIEIPNGVTSIGIAAFANCTKLKSIYITASVTTINATSYSLSPFNNCSPDMVIYCGAASKPDGWGEYWNNYNSSGKLEVIWGVSYEEYLAQTQTI